MGNKEEEDEIKLRMRKGISEDFREENDVLEGLQSCQKEQGAKVSIYEGQKFYMIGKKQMGKMVKIF